MALFGQISQAPIPFPISTPERALVDEVAGRALDAGIDLMGYGLEGLKSARVIVDPTADPSEPICLCSGTGQLLLEVLAAGFRLVPPEERAATAAAANALAARIIVAMAPSAESTSPVQQDEQILDNIYRAGLGLPVRLSRLGEDQLGIVVREASAFAKLMNLTLRVGGEEQENQIASYVGLLSDMVQQGQSPSIAFVDRATGGRPGVVGSITIDGLETFFAAFTVSFVVGSERMTRAEIADGASLRSALIELGRARREAQHGAS